VTEAMRNQAEAARKRADASRRRILMMVHDAGMGHIGSDLSVIDILTVLYDGVLRVDPKKPWDPDRDRFILSKGHCSGALYCTLAAAGFLPPEELSTYMQPRSRLNGHPVSKSIPGVEASTGPLGHGLSIAVGTALAARIDRALWRTFVVTGDGELQEGSNWEAAMMASQRGLDNLVLIVDRNRLQRDSRVAETVGLEPLSDRFQSFGWSVEEVNGNDHGALFDVLARLPFEVGKPSALIAHTVKGCGVSFMEDGVEWHHRVPTDNELERALAELEGHQ